MRDDTEILVGVPCANDIERQISAYLASVLLPAMKPLGVFDRLRLVTYVSDIAYATVMLHRAQNPGSDDRPKLTDKAVVVSRRRAATIVVEVHIESSSIPLDQIGFGGSGVIPEVAIKSSDIDAQVLVVVAYPDIRVVVGAVHLAEPEDGHLGEAHITAEVGSIHAARQVGRLSCHAGYAETQPSNQAQ